MISDNAKRMTTMNKFFNILCDTCYICLQELKNVFRDQGVLIFLVVVPLAYPLLYSWIYNNEVAREVPVAIVDLSHSHTSREFTRMIDASPDTRVALRCNSLDEARQRIGRGDAYGVVYFPEDFQTKLNRMEQTHVGVYCDMSIMLAYKAIFQTCVAIQGELNSRIQVKLSGNYTDRENEISTLPLKYEEVAMFNPTGGYGNFILPGVLMLIIQQTLLLGIGMLYGSRRERGFVVTESTRDIMQRRFGMARIVTGRTLCMLVLYAAVSSYVLLAIPKMFHFVQILHPVDIVLFVLPYLLACIFFAMVLGTFIPQREDVMLVVVFSSVLLLFMSGVSWPQSNIPSFWRAFACIFPSTFGIQGFVKLNTMGALLSDISYECRALWIQAVVYGVLAVWLLQRRYNRFKA